MRNPLRKNAEAVGRRETLTYTRPMLTESEPTLNCCPDAPERIILQGAWLAHLLAADQKLQDLQKTLDALAKTPGRIWDLRGLQALDHLGAQLLWRSWGHQRPAQLVCLEQHEGLFDRLSGLHPDQYPPPVKERLTPLMKLGSAVLLFYRHANDMLALMGQLVLDLLQLIRHPLRGPWKEISANIYRMGAQALGITALVGILIGIVLSYLSAQQLRTFGGDLFIVNILGMSIIRELGPMLAAILVAGRSGSAITAQLGVMRVTEELDAMRVMGIPHGFRLILPKVIALAIAMPLIVIWTDVMALAGGMISAQALLGMTPEFFIYKLPEAVPILNYWIGLLKGMCFGILIALIACHFGLRIEPNTESLGKGTTSSVVSAITLVIIADAVFAIIFNKVGY